MILRAQRCVLVSVSVSVSVCVCVCVCVISRWAPFPITDGAPQVLLRAQRRQERQAGEAGERENVLKPKYVKLNTEKDNLMKTAYLMDKAHSLQGLRPREAIAARERKTGKLPDRGR
jgi:hypothetical protein